ncbi:hypothetical protein MUP79_01090 [Candidatus Bathyarchaeota archaeon]|jgi:hypothetical protein|nr:hypothetical protein [Candidatus Bathyarchaeota archaeon]
MLRSWYYFRIGYSTYLTFLLGIASTLITVYYLAIKSAPNLLAIFPHFETFALICSAIGLPLSIIIGWAHLKGSRIWSTEQDIAVEANPYYYKLAPGYTKEVYARLYLEVLRLGKVIAGREGLLADEDRSRIQSIEKDMETLLAGGYVGVPRNLGLRRESQQSQNK